MDSEVSEPMVNESQSIYFWRKRRLAAGLAFWPPESYNPDHWPLKNNTPEPHTPSLASPSDHWWTNVSYCHFRHIRDAIDPNKTADRKNFLTPQNYCSPEPGTPGKMQSLQWSTYLPIIDIPWILFDQVEAEVQLTLTKLPRYARPPKNTSQTTDRRKKETLKMKYLPANHWCTNASWRPVSTCQRCNWPRQNRPSDKFSDPRKNTTQTADPGKLQPRPLTLENCNTDNSVPTYATW